LKVQFTMPASQRVGELIGELTVAHASVRKGVTSPSHAACDTATLDSGTAIAGGAGTSTTIAP